MKRGGGLLVYLKLMYRQKEAAGAEQRESSIFLPGVGFVSLA